jgi:hypothetical protein
VVVITFSGNRDCIVVPAYSVDGFKINEYIALAREEGLEDDQIFVQLDNAQYIDFTCHFPAKEAFWCTARFRRLSQHAVQHGKRIGQMKPAGMRHATRLIALAETDARALSKNAVKALRNLVKVLELESPQSANTPLPP